MNLGMMKRRAVQKSLPYDAEVEYLESNGTQYINLPFSFAPNDKILLDAAILETSSNKYAIAPARWETAHRFAMCGYYNNKFGVAYGTSQTGSTVSNIPSDTNFHVHEYSNKIFSIDNNVAFDASSLVFNGTETSYLRLFYGFNTNSKCRIRRFYHEKDNDNKIDLVSVRIGNVGYMYDKVSKQLFADESGVGFILGPDK